MSKLNLIVHPVRKEFCKEKCGFDHTPADDFVKSQWQSRSKSVAYLIYRWCIALFFVCVAFESMYNSPNFWIYFIYMTNWGIIICVLTNILGAILVTTWHYHPQYADKLLNMESLTSPFRIYWGMHIIALVWSIVVTILYWSVLYNPAEIHLNATSVLTHAFNSICMFIDFLIVAHPLRLLHMFLPVLCGIIYGIFSFIYATCGGLNHKGQPYIYHTLDWSRPDRALRTVIGVLILHCFVYMALFVLYKLKTFVHRQLQNSSLFLPTTASTTTTNANGGKSNNSSTAVSMVNIQHSPSGISMVLGNYPDLDNQAFSASGENITKY